MAELFYFVDLEGYIMRRTSPGFEKDRLYTLEEYENLDFRDDAKKYELIDAAVYVSPKAGMEEGWICSELFHHFALFDSNEKLGQFWPCTCFKVAPGFGPWPDIAFIKAARVPPISQGPVTTYPDLAVEVWSPYDLSTKAHREEARHKIRLYQLAGVPVVWAINPANRSVEVYHPGQVSPVQVLGEDDELSGEDVIPGFSMPVRALFE